METSKELVSFCPETVSPPDIEQANILMSNDTPPRACLTDFGFMTMVLDPQWPISCSAQLEGGTITFMPPELLMPSEFNIKNSVPTPEADVYAFGLVILQARHKDYECLLLAYTLQVLTGEIPFRGIRMTELALLKVQGFRPDKPADASAIGFSDSLWDFVQSCWDRNKNSRPKVAEVVMHLAEAAAGWYGLMPPCDRGVVCVPEGSMPDSWTQHRTFGNPIPSQYYLCNSDPGRIFDPPGAALEGIFRQLWKDVTHSIGKDLAVWALAKILAEEEGRAFVLGLDRKDAERCIDIMGHVSHDLCSRSSFWTQMGWPGHCRRQSQNHHRETRFLHHIEQTCRASWETPGADDDSRKD